MKKILCFLVIAALVAQICARPGDKEGKKPVDEAKKVAKKAKDDAKKDADKAEDAAKDVKKKLEKGADDAKDAAEKGADDEAKKPKHHKGGLIKGIVHTGEGVVDKWAGLADDVFGI